MHRTPRTITIDCAMSAWLFAIALDLFSATFVACAADPTSLLRRQCFGVCGGGILCGSVMVIVIMRILKVVHGRGILLIFARKRARRSRHDWISEVRNMHEVM